MAIENWSITIFDSTWVTEDDDLSNKVFTFMSWMVFIVRRNVTSLDVLNGETFDVETNIITWDSLNELSVMHFDRFDFSDFVGWSKSNSVSWFEDTSFDSSDWNCTDTEIL